MDFYKAIKKDSTIQALAKKIRSGDGTFADINKMVDAVSSLVLDAALAELNDAPTCEEVRAVLEMPLQQGHEYLVKLVTIIINQQYASIGVGLKALVPEYNKYRMADLIDAIVEGINNGHNDTGDS